MNALGKYEVEIDKLRKIALKLDRACKEGEIATELPEKAQDYLNSVAGNIIDSKSVGSEAYIVYEVQALLHWVKGEEDDSRDLAKSAVIVKGDKKLFTETATALLDSPNIKTKKEANSQQKSKNFSLTSIFIIFVIFIILGAIVRQSMSIIAGDALSTVGDIFLIVWIIKGIVYLTRKGK